MSRSTTLRTSAVVGTVLALTAGFGAVQLLAGSPAARAQGLEPWSTCDELLEHYRGELVDAASPYGFDLSDDGSPVSTAGSLSFQSSPSRNAFADGSAELAAVQPSTETGTNVQEVGVDEPDLAKLVDGRVVAVSKGRLRVLSAGPQPSLLGSADLALPADPTDHRTDLSFGPGRLASEVLVTEGRALVLTNGYTSNVSERTTVPDHSELRRPPNEPMRPITTVQLFELTDGDPTPVETLTLDGRYVSARLVGSTVRLVTSSSPTPPPAVQPQGSSDAAVFESWAANREAAANLTLDEVLPAQRRSAADGTTISEGRAVECEDVVRAESPVGRSTLVVTTLQPSAGLEAVDRDAVTTDGDIVYASADRLYVATSRWGTTGPVRPMPPMIDAPVGPGAPGRSGGDLADPEPSVTTELHAFDTSAPGRTEYVASGSVPGYLLDRWALSHHEGVLRVASTIEPTWSPDGQGRPSSSMVLKLVERGDELVETGRVEGLGLTEEIKSVRYFGDLAAVVTFREIDPLYLIDLSGPPRLLGELKVPGFSAYLHPIGDDLLLAVGRGQGPGLAVDHVQFSVFDVSDRSAPRLVDTHDLGPGWSEALNDAHAVMYDPERRLATITFTTRTGTGGLVGVRVDQQGGLSEAGSIPTGAVGLPEGWRVFPAASHLVAVGPDRLLTIEPTGFDRITELTYAN